LPRQQSHHCGIETLQRLTGYIWSSLQQSHHCGIETFPAAFRQIHPMPAAIAPLWD